MRFSPSFLAIEFLRNGYTPQQAADMVIDRINNYYPANSAAIVVVDMEGNYGSACQIFSSVPISIYHSELDEVRVEVTKCRQIGDRVPGSGSSLKVSQMLIAVIAVGICTIFQ